MTRSCHLPNATIRATVLLLFILVAFPAQAHRVSDSYLSLRVEGTSITGQWDVALRDLDLSLSLDANGDGDVTSTELEVKQQEIHSFVERHLHVTIDGAAATLQVGDLKTEVFNDGPYAVLELLLDAPHPPEVVGVEYEAFFDHDPQHRGLMRLETGGTTQTAVFSPGKTGAMFRLKSPERWRQFVEFLREGVWHIWLGFDHILFLLALLLPSVLRRGPGGWEVVESFRPALIKVVKIVTAFTVAHSITLSLAALEVVELPSRLVESVIAASVMLAAFNNLRPIFPERGWIVAFVFGLIHGFGFAGVLAELGLPREALAASLVGFNLGVELGQLAIVAMFLPLAFGLRGSWAYQRVTLRYGSVLIILLAATWLTERIWSFKVLPF